VGALDVGPPLVAFTVDVVTVPSEFIEVNLTPGCADNRPAVKTRAGNHNTRFRLLLIYHFLLKTMWLMNRAKTKSCKSPAKNKSFQHSAVGIQLAAVRSPLIAESFSFKKRGPAMTTGPHFPLQVRLTGRTL
jgi:hypothetical protein